MKTKDEMILAIRQKIVDKFSISIDDTKFVGDYVNTAEQKQTALKATADKIFIITMLDLQGKRIGADVLRDKNTGEYEWNMDGPTTTMLFTPNPGPTVESLSEKASKIAKGLGASHVEIVDVNAYIQSCKLIGYMPVTGGVEAKSYVMYKDGDDIKYKVIM